MDDGVEGAKHEWLVEEWLGVIGEGHVLAEGDRDDIGTVMDGELEVREDIDGGKLHQTYRRWHT